MTKMTDSFRFKDDREVTFIFEPSTLMQMYKMCRKNYPGRFSGSLLGLSIVDDDTGAVTFEITDIICTTDKTTILNVSRFIENDCEVLGHFKSSESDAPQSDLDTIVTLKGLRSTGKDLPYLMVVCDPLAGEADEISKCFQIVRLGPSEEKPLVAARIEMNPTALQRAFLFEWSLANEVVRGATERNLGPLKNGSGSVGRKLGAIYRGLDDITTEQEAILKHVREKERHAQRVTEWTEKRRLENQNRYLQDQEPLPVTRAAAIQAVGEAPAPLTAGRVKGIATTQALLKACDDLASEQKESVIRQKILSNAF